MDEFKFKIGDRVKITVSGESGEVIGRADYDDGAEDRFQIRYKGADGRAVETWWAESALEAAE